MWKYVMLQVERESGSSPYLLVSQLPNYSQPCLILFTSRLSEAAAYQLSHGQGPFSEVVFESTIGYWEEHHVDPSANGLQCSGHLICPFAK
jgi:hypothetical protein